ncbi:MAG: ATP-binding protein [Lentimicrobiaceae bacterium]|nr:ATP-binding protein [Lentimicrobiaceae bacterium]
MQFVYEVEAGNFTKAGNASSDFKKVLKQLNVPPQIIKRTVIALYEGEVNIVAHSLGGKIECEITPDHVVINLIDVGPGIPDIEKAMQEGYSTASAAVREMGFGAGMGLSNMKRNTDSMHITSSKEDGTTVTLKINLT